ncbi:MAG: ectonucleotide pyrophosphatase/phosphodiesterase [bacterium]|nr:alkaline phosphatase family protein [Gammaproteobacteria bacterium]HIL97256.1 alkaline phosphatase family protein [Pseudomonadales bacterium]
MGPVQFLFRRAVLLVLILASLIPVASQGQEPIVIVLSWDGMRHDYPDFGDFPGLKRVEEEGIRAQSLIPVYPSSTFPGHVSLATGAAPGVHGILDNSFYDRKKGSYSYDSDANWIDAEPVWIAAERQGVKAATFFWVGSETDWHQQGTSYRIAPFNASTPENEKVDQIIQWLDLVEAKRPRLIMSYWSGTDGTAHRKGPNHPDIVRVIKEQDKQLQRLLAAVDQRELWPRTTLMIVSDHGMTAVSHSVEVETALENAGFDVRIVGGDSVQHLFLADMKDQDQVLEILKKKKQIKVYRQSELPESFQFVHPDRIGDVIVTTNPPYSLRRSNSLLKSTQDLIANLMDWNVGLHGYSPTHPDMAGIFLAMGNGVNKSKLGPVHQLNVAPTITSLLGIEAPLDAKAPPISLTD